MALDQVKYGKPIGGWELVVRRPSENFLGYDNPSFRRRANRFGHL
ncbi:hypothetical protein SynA1544_01235 [Synechococcus sp. A15-44]|nr:hypothetical protein SynA1544_01235 [Synechococcus sp. A15-44]